MVAIENMVVTAATTASSKKLSTFPCVYAFKGTEKRDDSPESGSIDNKRAVPSSQPVYKGILSDVASSLSVRTGTTSIPGRKSIAAPSVSSCRSTASSIKTDHGASNSSRIPETTLRNEIVELGKEFELGFGGSVASLRSKNSAAHASDKTVQSESVVHILDETSDYNAFNTKSHKRSSLYICPNEHHSSKSSANVSMKPNVEIHPTTDAMMFRCNDKYEVAEEERGGNEEENKGVTITKPLETIRIDNRSRRILSCPSSKKEQSLQRRQLKRRSELEFWSGLSVRVAMAVMQANGSEKMARRASNIVLEEGRRQSGQDRSSKVMCRLSTKLSVALLEAGGDEKVASAAVLTVMMASEDNGTNVVQSTEIVLFDDNSTVWSQSQKEDAPSLASTIESNCSKSRCKVSPPRSIAHNWLTTQRNESPTEESVSITQSNSSKRRLLKSFEKVTEEKKRAIEDAELHDQERKKEFSNRMAILDATTNEKKDVLDAVTASLQTDPQEIQADQVGKPHEKKQQKDYVSETTSSFQRLQSWFFHTLDSHCSNGRF